MQTQTLGDAGAPNDDASYGGPVSTSALSMDYYRSKITEFQSVLNAVDEGYRAATSALQSGALDPASADDLRALLADYDSRRFTLRATAEAINAGAAVVNAAGGRMPSLSLPGTLGLLPAALPFAAVAAVGAAAVLITWGREWIAGVNDRLKSAQLIAAQDTPEKAAALAASIAQSDAALRVAEGSGLAALSTWIKWGAIALGGYMVWRALQGGSSRD